MGLFDFIFWKGLKRYNYTLFDVSEEGEFIKEMKHAYARPGVNCTISQDLLERDKQIIILETDMQYAEEELNHAKSSDYVDGEDIKFAKMTKGLLRLLKADKIRVFSAVVEMDTNYITKHEKNDLIEKREEVQERILQKIINEYPE